MIALALLPFILPAREAGRKQSEPKEKEIACNGIVAAYQKWARHSVKPESRGIATYAERWIVRVDRWPDGAENGDKYILVEYSLTERGLSDNEINSTDLRFTLRKPGDNEHTDCMGTIPETNERQYVQRPVELSDYERTKPGKDENIPSLRSIPCFITNHPPVADGDKNSGATR
jgi:hypothetical protein